MSITRAALAKRRTQENIVREREAYIKGNFKTERVTEWEHRTLHRIKNQDICNRVQKIAENEKQKNCRWYNAWCILSASSTTTRQDIGVSQAYNPTSPVTKELVVAPKAERARGGVVVRW